MQDQLEPTSNIIYERGLLVRQSRQDATRIALPAHAILNSNFLTKDFRALHLTPAQTLSAVGSMYNSGAISTIEEHPIVHEYQTARPIGRLARLSLSQDTTEAFIRDTKLYNSPIEGLESGYSRIFKIRKDGDKRDDSSDNEDSGDDDEEDEDEQDDDSEDEYEQDDDSEDEYEQDDHSEDEDEQDDDSEDEDEDDDEEDDDEEDDDEEDDDEEDDDEEDDDEEDDDEEDDDEEDDDEEDDDEEDDDEEDDDEEDDDEDDVEEDDKNRYHDKEEKGKGDKDKEAEDKEEKVAEKDKACKNDPEDIDQVNKQDTKPKGWLRDPTCDYRKLKYVTDLLPEDMEVLELIETRLDNVGAILDSGRNPN